MNDSYGKVGTLLQKISEKLGWGEVSDWNNYDFNQLSQLILEETEVQLSNVTLKRVFGKIKYDSHPSTHTLNALSQFAGYLDWRDFLIKNTKTKHPETKVDKKTPTIVTTKISKFKYLFVASILSVFALLLYGGISQKKSIQYQSKDFNFDLQKIGEGIPSSVIFRYDAENALPNSNVEIQQNWDLRRRETVKSSDSIHTSIYYYPGFYEAKLVVDDQVVQERELFLPSNGWITAIEQKPTPIYVSSADNKKDDALGISPEYLKAQGIYPQSETQSVNYSFTERFDIFSDDFSFKANIKSEKLGGVNICQKIQTLLLFEGEAMIIPLAKSGCIADLNLLIPNLELLDGKTKDLSMFGAETENWTPLQILSKEGQLSIFINDKLVKNFPFSISPIRLIGFRFRFQGTGWIKDVMLNDKRIL